MQQLPHDIHLTTERLVLTDLGACHENALLTMFKLGLDYPVLQYFGSTIDDQAHHYARQGDKRRDENPRNSCLVAFREQGRDVTDIQGVAVLIAIDPQDARFKGVDAVNHREVGYFTHPSFEGRGYATEAITKMVATGIDLGMTGIWASVDPLKLGSIAILERKLGMAQVDDMKESPYLDAQGKPRPRTIFFKDLTVG